MVILRVSEGAKERFTYAWVDPKPYRSKYSLYRFQFPTFTN